MSFIQVLLLWQVILEGKTEVLDEKALKEGLVWKESAKISWKRVNQSGLEEK